MHIMLRYIIILKHTCLNFCMFDWSWKKGDMSGGGGSQGISCVSGNPEWATCLNFCMFDWSWKKGDMSGGGEVREYLV